MRAVAWPLKPGRDLDEYLYAYVQLFDHDVLLPWSMLFRTPVTPLVAGRLARRLRRQARRAADGGPVRRLDRLLGRRGAVLRAAGRARRRRCLLLYQGYALMFHELSSEPVFAAAFAVWALLVVRAAFAPSVGRFALVGLGVAVLALVRPGNAVLLAFGIVPLLVAGTWRSATRADGRLRRSPPSLPLAAWSVHNGVRFDSWALARGGNAIIPFYRAFITDHIVSPENGEQSRRLAAAMQQHLLTREPYRSYGVTLDELFDEGSFRVHEDLYLLSDQVFGWDSDYRVLRGAGIEGVRAHPGTYARGVARTVWDELAKAQFRAVASARRRAAAEPAEPRQSSSTASACPRRPRASRSRPGQVVWISRPDQSIRQVWTSPTEWHFEFEHAARPPTLRARSAAKSSALFGALPDRTGNARLALRLNQLSRWFPRPWMWILLGLVAIALRRPRGWPMLVALGARGLAVVLLNALGLFADLHFVLPVAPAFVLLGAGGLLGERRHDGPTPAGATV